MSGYVPTAHLRWLRKKEYLDGVTAFFIPRLQQLWQSQYEGDTDEWRDVPTIPDAAPDAAKEGK